MVNARSEGCKIGEERNNSAGRECSTRYRNNTRKTKRIIKGGWLYTGDVVFRDSEGDLFIVGRKKNFINAGADRSIPSQ
jgi:acyl-CoA synthetase (AMP-forming)/AMP-acid ligase II